MSTILFRSTRRKCSSLIKIVFTIMNVLIEFLVVFKGYLVEVLPFLFMGFLLSGLIHEFIPTRLVEKHLGGKGIKPILCSTLNK